MTSPRSRAVSAVLIALLSASTTLTAGPASKFLWLSDLHFDPTADPKLVDSLADASVDQWPGILASSPSGLSGFGSDANWALLSSSLDALRKTAPDVEFTIVTGDLLVHRFREKFEAAAKNHDDAAFRRFATKTVLFMVGQLGAIAPGKPVLYTPGNNDSDCGDYALQPHGPFLKDQGTAIAHLLGPLSDEASARDWAALGSYDVRHPSLKHLRLIAVNSNYFSPRYRNSCAATEGDAALDQMRWLRDKLAEAKKNHDKVWLFFHIPPGIDGYSSAHPRHGEPAQTVFMWQPVYTVEFEKLLLQYHDTVKVSLAGHEHVDDFRLIGKSLVLMTPGLSPVVRQNPSFRVVDFRSDGNLANATTYYLSNLDAVLKGAPTEWKTEYDFAGAWRISRLDFKNFSKLAHQIEVKPAAHDRWTTLYSASNQLLKTSTEQSFPQVFCAAGNATEASFKTCVMRLH